MPRLLLLVIFMALVAAGMTRSGQEKQPKVGAEKKKMGTRPPVNLTYYLSEVEGPNDREALRAALEKVKSMKSATVSAQGTYATVQFDSHVVSYHQIAQAITDAGAVAGKKYAPRLKLHVPEYAQKDNATYVDALFAGKRLNQRVRIEAVDKNKGEFVLHFLPLQVDSADPAPQGFNGGHLNHPIHDAPPRGLGLQFRYVTEDPAKKEPAK